MTNINPIIEAWSEWRNKGLYPYPGGWAMQPLSILAQVKAMELAFNTVQYIDSGASWTKLSPTQADLIRELNL